MKDFFQLRESVVKTADKKPETYVGPDGKTRTRMVPTDKEVVKAEQTELDEISVKAMADKIANSGSKGLKQTMKANKADELRKTLDAMKARLATEEKDPEEYDQEGDMMKSQLRQICSANEKLMQMVGDDDNLPEWVQAKVTKANDYIRSVRDYLESENMEEKTLTPAEKKKREEIAKAMERENPGMDMSKKMAIATATAKRVAEEIELDEVSSKTLTNYITKASSQAGKTSTPAKTQDKRIAGIAIASKKAMAKEEAEQIDEISKEKAADYHAKSVQFQKDALRSNDPKKLKKIGNRLIGVAKANKITGKTLPEEVEQIDEVKKGDYVTHYKTGAVGLVTNVSGDKEIADVKWNKTGRQTSHPRKYLQKMKEEVELDEAIMQGSKEHLKKLQGMLDKTKPGSADHSQIRGAIESMFGKQHIPAKHRNVKPDMYQEVKKPDAVEVIRKKQQMAAISASDKDKLAKIRSMLNKEKKR